ncbi:hypothetical protein BJY17_000973 [Agromyces hippuratus]|uniref:Uncharacterized protein n=1 Tax=Agromyces hippuratus TaxID=286438 RepID=A0A852WQK4_9MICO|nr:hypothetical protein [Agromyces hippuratus]
MSARRGRGGPTHVDYLAASRIIEITLSGWLIIGTCEVFTSTVVASARAAMAALRFGRDDAVVLGHHVPAGDRRPGRRTRWSDEGCERPGALRAGHVLRHDLRDVLREQFREERRVDEGIGITFGRAGERAEHEMVDHVGVAAAESVRGLDGFSLGQRVGGDEDERLDVRVARGRIADHGAAVGVADEHDGPADGAEELSKVVAVVLRPAQRVRERDDRVALGLQRR